MPRTIAALFVCCCWLPLVAGDALPAQSVGTPEETSGLVMLNLLRTDYRRGQHVVLKAVREKRLTAHRSFGLVWTRVVSNEKAKPCPLVFSPHLMTAARNLLEAGNFPTAKETFNAQAAARAAGYPAADKPVVACFGANAPDLEAAFAATALMVVGEDAPKPTFIVPRYAASIMCESPWREVGIATATAGGKTSMVIVFGTGHAARHLGGVVYRDENRNGRFDAGEGIPEVPVEVGALRTTTGPGGAWTILPGAGELLVVIGPDGMRSQRPIAAESSSAHIAWQMPTAAAIKSIDALIAAANKAQAEPDPAKRIGPLAALLLATRGVELDTARDQQVVALIAPIADRFALMREDVLAVLSEEPKTAAKAIAEQRKRWNGALGPWFKEADKLIPLRQQVLTARTAPPGNAAKQAGPLLAQLDKAIPASVDPAFVELYQTWKSDLLDLMDKAAAPTP